MTVYLVIIWQEDYRSYSVDTVWTSQADAEGHKRELEKVDAFAHFVDVISRKVDPS